MKPLEIVSINHVSKTVILAADQFTERFLGPCELVPLMWCFFGGGSVVGAAAGAAATGDVGFGSLDVRSSFSLGKFYATGRAGGRFN